MMLREKLVFLLYSSDQSDSFRDTFLT